MCSFFFEDSYHMRTSQIDLQFGSIRCFLYDATFYWKISDKNLVCYDLNIVNNCKQFIYLFLYFLCFLQFITK